jgi:hypothetical protein
MLGHYAAFFAASAGFTGLLLVAPSIVNHDDTEYDTRERRTILAGTAFLALIDIFFVSLTSSLGGVRMFATASLVMAAVGLLGTSHFMPRARRAGNVGRGLPRRPLNIFFAAIAATGYAVQLSLAVALLSDPESSGLVRRAVEGVRGRWDRAPGSHEVAYPGHLEERNAESVRTPRAETS